MSFTKLLVSVRNAKEAHAALEGGADIIDVKEPSYGALGAATNETVGEVIDVIAGAVPVTAALGELAEYKQSVPLVDGLFAAKLGMSGTGRLNRNARNTLWTDALDKFGAVQRVAVAYGDYQTSNSPPPELVVCDGYELGCRFFLVDTNDKSLSLEELVARDHAFAAEIDRAISVAKSLRMRVVIAGSLRQKDLRSVVDKWSPDFVAVRGAACNGGRIGDVCKLKVRSLKDELLVLKNSIVVSAAAHGEDKPS